MDMTLNSYMSHLMAACERVCVLEQGYGAEHGDDEQHYGQQPLDESTQLSTVHALDDARIGSDGYGRGNEEGTHLEELKSCRNTRRGWRYRKIYRNIHRNQRELRETRERYRETRDQRPEREEIHRDIECQSDELPGCVLQHGVQVSPHPCALQSLRT